MFIPKSKMQSRNQNYLIYENINLSPYSGYTTTYMESFKK